MLIRYVTLTVIKYGMLPLAAMYLRFLMINFLILQAGHLSKTLTQGKRYYLQTQKLQ